ncbi:ribonuclease D [Oceanicoccus sagamiensis]|uniref:Ribonuclease D n=1 Tax=Oceanicoccus sagamiensis TaxID=716816 RepID=A0A1X9NPS1_9GAMM|nr:ribonuclease D [Oceanicoccus sagamiensis]ARN75883.1 ribonuclease D [Oceanicoccus sagamiensis]
MLSRQIDHPVYIDTNEALAQFCQQWSKATVLALDTEFIRTDTFYPIGALIQVSDGSGCFLIDPLPIDDFSPFKVLMTDPAITKVLHSCSEDLEVFDRLLGVLPTPLIDTQIAAGMNGLGFSLGYQAMTEALLQIHVAKGETRSNWLQRPLTDSQIHYAALDVAYLPDMYTMLCESLEAQGRMAWLQEECNKLINGYGGADAIRNHYLKVKSAWKLSAAQLGVLQLVVEWREHKARDRDRPRGRVLKDRSCFEIARLQPDSIRALSGIDEIGPKTVRNNGDDLLKLIKQGQSLPKTELPPALPKPLPPANGTIMKRLKAHVAKRAEQLNMAPELLARKKDYESLLRSGFHGDSYQLPDTLSGWRKSVVGDELLAILAKEGV